MIPFLPVTVPPPQTTITGCQPYPVTWYSPTGVVDCEVYGVTTASWYHGSAAARNDCTWPWTDCATIRVTSLETGRSLVITPAMYCDCYLGDDTPANDRGVDLTPEQVKALGLTLGQGLYPVLIEREP